MALELLHTSVYHNAFGQLTLKPLKYRERVEGGLGSRPHVTRRSSNYLQVPSLYKNLLRTDTGSSEQNKHGPQILVVAAARAHVNKSRQKSVSER